MANTKNQIIMKFIATTSDKLDKILLKSGQLIFTTDDRTIYLDTDKRTTYAAIMTIVDDETRRNLPSPIEGFYYVRTENALWNYNNGRWIQMTGQQSNLQFKDGALPNPGESDILYVDNTALYRWNSIANKYDMVGGVDWKDL